jgi:hypothetical protein
MHRGWRIVVGEGECKRVGMSGHIPNLLGTWGLSAISLGKSVSQERQAKK